MIIYAHEVISVCKKLGVSYQTAWNHYKAAWYGKEVVKVDRWFASSKTCSCCGWKNEKLTVSDRVFECLACGLKKRPRFKRQ